MMLGFFWLILSFKMGLKKKARRKKGLNIIPNSYVVEVRSNLRDSCQSSVALWRQYFPPSFSMARTMTMINPD